MLGGGEEASEDSTSVRQARLFAPKCEVLGTLVPLELRLTPCGYNADGSLSAAASSKCGLLRSQPYPTTDHVPVLFWRLLHTPGIR